MSEHEEYMPPQCTNIHLPIKANQPTPTVPNTTTSTATPNVSK
jgi:hypothetical protein